MTRPVDDDPARRADPEDAPADAEGPLVCAACRAPVTDERHAIARAGAHAHTFVNLGGFTHHVRCFGYAAGLSARGAPASYFSWFPGHTWQIVHCARCGAHLGWIFRCGGEAFWGLLRDGLAPG